jgi:Arc/MetJ-type ribon-helix-helix transcriptional regulator
MSYPFPPDVRQLVHQAMTTGEFASEDELLRDALTAWRDRNADLAAIRRGIADMEAGRMRPFEDAVRDFDQRHGLIDE